MSNSIKSFDEVLGLSDTAYMEYVNCILEDSGGYLELDELDDKLVEIVGERPSEVERICRINLVKFRAFAKDISGEFLLAYNYNTLVGALVYQKKIAEAKLFFFEGITYCSKKNNYEAGKSLSENIFHLWSLTQIPFDEAPYFLTQIVEFYKALEKYDDATKALRAAALHFADAGAYQSAYRALRDAQEIAISQKMFKSQIKNLETQGMVALIEGDLSCADSEFKKCFDFYKQIGETPSNELRANAALVMLHRNDYKGARDIYEILEVENPKAISPDLNRQIKINLLVCCRELADKPAIKSLSLEIEGFIDQLDLEQRIEARLVLAKTYFCTNWQRQGIQCLKTACVEIQLRIDQYQRLHYRRGIRKHYSDRIKSMLFGIEALGGAEDVLLALVLISSNSLLDWFSVLKWIDTVVQSKIVSLPRKDELLLKKEELIRFGTPFLYGFREKYDDPFDFGNGKFAEAIEIETARALNYSLPWHEFNDLTAGICEEYNFPSPFETASIQYIEGLLKRKIGSGTAFLFSFACTEGCVFIFLFGSEYIRTSISLNDLLQYKRSLSGYQKANDGVNRHLFKKELARLQVCLEPNVFKIAEVLEMENLSELIFVPDYFTEGIPILPSILNNDRLRRRMKETGFVFRACPTLTEVSAEQIISGPILCVSDSDDNLELVASERSLVRKAFAGEDYYEVDLAHETIDFSKSPAFDAKILHLASHNISAGEFTDPFFVATAIHSKNGVWLESVQREAHKLQFKLVVLNGCNTGTTGNRNFFKNFKTSEKVGLTSAFLLNRQCGVVATQWNEPDIVSYTFSALFYKRLAIQPNAAQCFTLALIDLYELTIDGATQLFQEIIDDPTRQAQLNSVGASKTPFPFRSVFCFGMFQFHSLLIDKPLKGA